MSDFTPPKVAALTGYSARQIQRFARLGEIPGAALTSGGHWRFPDSPELRAWIAAAGKTASAAPLPRTRTRARGNYVPHLTRLLTVLRSTAAGMSEAEAAAFVEDFEPLREIAERLRERVTR